MSQTKTYKDFTELNCTIDRLLYAWSVRKARDALLETPEDRSRRPRVVFLYGSSLRCARFARFPSR
jgi:hypothetical protein